MTDELANGNYSHYPRGNGGKYHQRNRELVDAAKAVPCADCGVSYPPCVMEFDHRGEDKVANVGAMVCSASPERIRAEIAKCDVVCANCHAIRTHTMRRYRDWRTKVAN